MFGNVSMSYQRHEKISCFKWYPKGEPNQNKKVLTFLKTNLTLFYVDQLIKDHLTIWKNFDHLQLIVLDKMRSLLAVFIFFNIQWKMMTIKLSSTNPTITTVLVTNLQKWEDVTIQPIVFKRNKLKSSYKRTVCLTEILIHFFCCFSELDGPIRFGLLQ